MVVECEGRVRTLETKSSRGTIDIGWCFCPTSTLRFAVSRKHVEPEYLMMIIVPALHRIFDQYLQFK